LRSEIVCESVCLLIPHLFRGWCLRCPIICECVPDCWATSFCISFRFTVIQNRFSHQRFHFVTISPSHQSHTVLLALLLFCRPSFNIFINLPEAVTLLTFIREVSVQIFVGISTILISSLFSSVCPRKCGCNTQKQAMATFFQIFHFYHSLIILRHDVRKPE
jgi:hypothetical protein